jgi:hypothetical protein
VLAGAGGSIESLAMIDSATFNPVDSDHGRFAMLAPSNSAVCNAQQNCITPTSTVLSASMTGPTGTFVNPFARVDFYYDDPSTGRWVRIGTGTPSLTDTGFMRTWTYSLTWTPGGIRSASGVVMSGSTLVVAVGVHPSGSAVIAGNTIEIVDLVSS